MEKEYRSKSKYKNKYKKRLAVVLGTVVAGLMLGGCGESKTPAVDEGMAAVEALDYNTALQCLRRQ